MCVYGYKLLNFAFVKSVVHYDVILSHLPNSFSFYVRPLLFKTKKCVGGRHFVYCVREKKPENAFREVAPVKFQYGKKMTYFSGSIFFERFEKLPKDFAGALPWALRVRFRAREVFESFEKRTPGPGFSKGEYYYPPDKSLSSG